MQSKILKLSSLFPTVNVMQRNFNWLLKYIMQKLGFKICAILYKVSTQS